MTVWHENDEFWEKLAPFLFPEERWEVTGEEVDSILEILELEDGARILDLCCGPGRHALEFDRRGHTVVGVDRTSNYLQQAQRSAETEGLCVEFIQDDMRRFIRPASFDAVVLMFTSFGYFESHQDNINVLNNIRASLSDGGKVLIDLMGKEIMARIFQPRGWEERDGKFWLQERKIITDWSKIENRWILIEGKDRFEITFNHWLYSAVEISRMLKESGFTEVTSFGDLNGSEYGPEARRLVCVGHK